MSNYRHGMGNSKIYNLWNAMRDRCNNPNNPAFKNYGGRGIKVCPSWEDFENFYRDMGLPPDGCSLDRIDNNKGYCPENCRWATRVEQARNRRGRRRIAFKGEEKTMAEWADHVGISVSTLWARFNYGWSVERALTTKKMRQKDVQNAD